MKYVALSNERRFSLPFYLAMEEYVAREFPVQDYFFMWQVAPTVIFGRNQLLEKEVDVEFCKNNGIEFYRRKSGGGCVYADEGNIMLSYITPETNVNFTFNRYMLMVEHALQHLGIDARTTGRNDILIDGRKVSGNAFYHLPKCSIVHGTMLYDTDVNSMANATTPSASKLKSKGVESVRQRVTTIKEHISITLDDFKKSLRESLCNDTVVLNDNDVMAIEELSREYYSHEFIYGNNPACTYSSVARYDGVGELRLLLEIKENIIRRANLSGDFFIIGDIDDVLLSKLKNVPYTRAAVEEAVAGIDFGALIMNLNKEQLINLFFN